MKTKRLVITLPEYERIFRLVHSVSCSVEGIPGASCLFYNTVGAFLLEKNFRIHAKPLMGAAFIRVGAESKTGLAFATINRETGEVGSSRDGFHCWVETDEHVIDFSAPVYRESLALIGHKELVPRKMFQKRKADMATSPDELLAQGDYFVAPDPELSLSFLAKSPASLGDLANACHQWFARPPKLMKWPMTMIDNHGQLTTIHETAIRLSGAW